jgi:hypothetical protein
VSTPMMRVYVRGLPAAMMTIAVLGCGQSPITSTRIERAIASTFANLVQVQVSRMGLAPMAASVFEARATCQKAAGGSIGSGEWLCTVIWKGPDRRTLRDTYDLFVATDGCYMATVSGENLGGPILKAPDGREVRNLLYAFDGCFDPT